MAYAKGKRPFEYASKSGHSYIIADPAVQSFLDKCRMPTEGSDVSFAGHTLVDHNSSAKSNLEHVIAFDGGYSEVAVRPKFPSATMAFIQCGALSFATQDLDGLSKQSFIAPEDMTRLKNIERLKLALPMRGIRLEKETSFKSSVRRTIFEFFSNNVGETSLAETLAWLVFQEFDGNTQEWTLASCPLCDCSGVKISRSSFRSDCTFDCNHCNQELFITDVLRLHEAVDEEIGAGGILGYLVTTIEQIILVHFVKALLANKPAALSSIVFIKDGPLAYFGQTANLHKPMRALVKYLFDYHNFFAAGLEKSGAFVEHAQAIAMLLKPSQILILDNEYIYKYIIPGKADPNNPYGRTTYYGNKVIYKSGSGGMHVITLPTGELLSKPNASDLKNLHAVLDIVDRLRCDMYDNALIPIALANKLVSLSDHPSTKILERFAKSAIK